MAVAPLIFLVMFSPVAALCVCMACRRPRVLFWLAGGVIAVGAVGTALVIRAIAAVYGTNQATGEEGWLLYGVFFLGPFLLGAAAVFLIGGLVRRKQATRVVTAAGADDVSASTGS